MSEYVAVSLAVRRPQVEVFSNETSEAITSHIGLQPHASLKAQNSLYTIEFTRRYNQICTQMNAVISAHTCSKMMAKEGVVGGKIGVSPSHSCIRFYDTQFKTDLSLSILSSVQSDNILNHHIKTTSKHDSGGRKWLESILKKKRGSAFIVCLKSWAARSAKQSEQSPVFGVILRT